MILFYEHMAYILHNNIGADSIISFLESYNIIFPQRSADQTVYWDALYTNLFGAENSFSEYLEEVNKYIVEKVVHSLSTIQGMITQIEREVDEYLSEIPKEKLRDVARKALIDKKSKTLIEQAKNIKKFRPTSYETKEEKSEESLF